MQQCFLQGLAKGAFNHQFHEQKSHIPELSMCGTKRRNWGRKGDMMDQDLPQGRDQWVQRGPLGVFHLVLPDYFSLK
jgi:hypothetical protein